MSTSSSHRKKIMKAIAIARPSLMRDMLLALGLAVGAGIATAVAAGALVLVIAVAGT